MPVRRGLQRIAGILLPVILCLALSEGAVRLLTKRDSSGQLYFQGGRLWPYTIPVARVAHNLEKYAERPDSYNMYHPRLGWVTRPSSVSDNGLYRSNSIGLRSHREVEPSPPDGVLRIALFGDSHTHGDDIAYEQSWGYRLEELLAETGAGAEVLNFGVGGYGMDQAYLRWQIDGARYRPDVVVFGLAPSNIARNLNVFRSLLVHRTNIPFSKPRFVLEGDELRLINSPTLPIEGILPTLEDFAGSTLRPYEFFYTEDYADRWWLHSVLLNVGAKAIRRRLVGETTVACRGIDEEPARTASAIVDAFASEVAASGARFFVAHLPHRKDMRGYHAAGRFCYDDLLRRLDERHSLIRMESYFTDPDFERYLAGHYSAEGNELIARAVAEQIGPMLRSAG